MWNSVFTRIMSVLIAALLLLSGKTAADYDYSGKLGSADYTGLKEVYKGDFDIGTCVQSSQLDDANYVAALLKNNSSVTPEYEFKLPTLHPSENVWNFSGADKIANFARAHGLKIRGHALVWGTQDNWMLYDGNGKFVDKETFFAREYEYFKVVMNRYKDVVHTWDVVNEPFNYERGCTYKQSAIYQLCGEEYITRAYKMAHEIDPSAVLVLNETKIIKNSVKEENLLKGVQKFLDAGVPINAVGLQCHFETLNPNETAKKLDSLINKIAAMGLDVQITEFDMSYYSSDSTKYTEKPAWVETLQIKKYKEMFAVLRKDADKISSVTFWGLNDGVSYCRAGGRLDWPLLFDENNQPKQGYYAVCDF